MDAEILGVAFQKNLKTGEMACAISLRLTIGDKVFDTQAAISPSLMWDLLMEGEDVPQEEHEPEVLGGASYRRGVAETEAAPEELVVGVVGEEEDAPPEPDSVKEIAQRLLGERRQQAAPRRRTGKRQQEPESKELDFLQGVVPGVGGIGDEQ